jgi:hypothetical protein
MRYSLLIAAILCLPAAAADRYSDWKAPPPIATPHGPDYVLIGPYKTYALSREQMLRHGIKPGQKVKAERVLEILDEERER